MAKSKYHFSEAKLKKWQKEGRGAGQLSSYKPWLKTIDVPSQGRSHRIFGTKTQRTHHLLSDLELAIFLMLDWSAQVQDIREQFPLDRELTLELAETAEIRHPKVTGCPNVLSTDFLVNQNSQEVPKFAIQAKYSSDLEHPKKIEKLELERRYWEQKEIPWYIVTEKDISQTARQNIELLYPSRSVPIPWEDLALRLDTYEYLFQLHPTSTLIRIAQYIDSQYQLEPGTSLKEIHQLLAHRFIVFDIQKNALELTPNDITLLTASSVVEAYHA